MAIAHRLLPILLSGILIAGISCAAPPGPVASPTAPAPEQTPVATSHLTYSPPASNGSLISAEEAEARVRRFLGEPEASFEMTFQQGLMPHRGGDYPPVFYARRPSAGLGPALTDTFIVDATTGEVIRAGIPGNEQPVPGDQPTAKEEARAVAEGFARARYADFAALELVSELESSYSSDSTAAPTTYHATWQQRAPDSGALLARRVAVAVSMRSGRVTSYEAERGEYDGSTVPQIDRETAVAAALAAVRRSPDWAEASVSWSRLEVYRLDDAYRLLWLVDVAAGPGPRAGLGTTVFVDALSCAVLNPLPEVAVPASPSLPTGKEEPFFHWTAGRLALTWEDNSDNEDGFRLEIAFSRGGEPYEVVLSANTTTHITPSTHFGWGFASEEECLRLSEIEVRLWAFNEAGNSEPAVFAVTRECFDLANER